MAGDLKFKLVMDADTKSFVTNLNQSKQAAEKAIAAIKDGSASIVGVSDQATKAIDGIIPKNANERAAKLTESLNTITESLKSTDIAADGAIDGFKKLSVDSVRSLNILKANLATSKTKLEEFSKTNATPEDIRNAQQQVDALEKEVLQADKAFLAFKSELGLVNPEVTKLDAGLGKANEELQQTESTSRLASNGIQGLKTGLTALSGALATLGIGLGVRELAQAADSYTNLSARINIATKDGGDFASAMAGVHQVALITNSSLEATGSLFTRLNAVAKDMGMSQQQALDLTKTVTQAIQVGGGSAQASEAAVQQFIQAMQGGVLRGEEFNSIMENGYGLAEALAKGLGVTTGELRKMAENGELSSERVIKAVSSQATAIQATYDQFPTTIGNAMQRISTSWEILIGKMDQANGSSATVAQWLATLADNIAELDTVLLDIGEGFVWVGDQLKKVDPATIDALKTALISAYDSLKTLGSTVGGVFEVTADVLNTALSGIFFFGSGVDGAGEKTGGFTKLLQVLNVAIGFINDGFSTIGIAVNLFTGAMYSASAAFVSLASTFTWGGVKEAALRNIAEMQAKSEEYYKKASDGAMRFESQGVKAYTEIGKTQAQKNAEQIASSQQTLDQLKAQEEKHKADYKAISDERIQLEQQLLEARKSGNDAAIQLAVDNLAKLGAKEKAYQAESKKINDEKIQAAQDWVNAQLMAADGTQKVADAATHKTMQTTLAAQGLKLEFDSAGKAIVKAMEDGAKATENQGNAVDKARKAAVALSLDLDVVLNRVSEKFAAGQRNLNDFSAGLDKLGAKGKQAGDVTYQAWVKWLETAKSQAEIDAAKAKLIEFESQGVFSAKQVELGMQAIRQVIQKLPSDLDPVEQAFERLGIKTKEHLALAAQSALADFNTIQSSGKATAEGLRAAYERTMQAAAASGDAAIIASTQAKAASLGLQVQIDETGKASVQSMDEWTEANHRVRDSAGGIIDGYRAAGAVAREEAQSASEAWQAAVDKSNQEFRNELKNQQSMLSSLSDYESYSRGDVIKQIESMGYDSAEAKRLAGSIWSQGLAADRDAKYSGMGGFGPMDLIIDQEFDRAAAKGLTTQNGTNKINDLLRQLAGGSMVARTSAPTVSTPSAPRTVQNNISINGKTISIPVTEDRQGDFNDFLSELEKLKKAM